MARRPSDAVGSGSVEMSEKGGTTSANKEVANAVIRVSTMNVAEPAISSVGRRGPQIIVSYQDIRFEEGE